MTDFAKSAPHVIAVRFIALLAVCVASPLVFVLVEAVITRLNVPVFLESHSGVKVWLASIGVLGSVIASAVLCLPVGLFAPRRPALLGAFVGIAGASMLTWMWLQARVPLEVLRWLELAAFAGGCILFSCYGARWKSRVPPNFRWSGP